MVGEQIVRRRKQRSRRENSRKMNSAENAKRANETVVSSAGLSNLNATKEAQGVLNQDCSMSPRVAGSCSPWERKRLWIATA